MDTSFINQVNQNSSIKPISYTMHLELVFVSQNAKIELMLGGWLFARSVAQLDTNVEKRNFGLETAGGGKVS